ncbi:MAG: hypothetical protein ACFFDN_09710 [Candidatus Hodarchaeota archaeon]
MSEQESTESRLKLIQRTRYLVPCSCIICKQRFKDIILGEDHVYKQHKDRKLDNVIDNLEWDIEKDDKHWKIMKEIEVRRDKIIRALYDEDLLISIDIPKIFQIGKENMNLKNIVVGSEKIEKSKKDKLIDRLKNRVSKYKNNLLGENYLIGEDVLKPDNKRKITKIEQGLDEILACQKAFLLLSGSGLKKLLTELEQQVESKAEEEEELPSEEEEPEEETELEEDTELEE